jgi:DNA-binding NtrC family response regulator
VTELGEVRLPDPEDRTPTILLVEDEVLIRMATSDSLQECGFRVLEASSAAEAITMLQGSETPIDVVFSDIRMPGEMDGFGLAKWIREHRPGMCVLLTSGDATTAKIATGLCEKLEVVSKPYDCKLAAARIRELISANTSAHNA